MTLASHGITLLDMRLLAIRPAAQSLGDPLAHHRTPKAAESPESPVVESSESSESRATRQTATEFWVLC